MSPRTDKSREGLTKITVGALGLAQLGLQSPDPLPELIALSGISAGLGRFSLESSVLFLYSNEIEDNVKDSGKDEGKEKGGSGKVHYGSAGGSGQTISGLVVRRLTVSLGVESPGGAAS